MAGALGPPRLKSSRCHSGWTPTIPDSRPRGRKDPPRRVPFCALRLCRECGLSLAEEAPNSKKRPFSRHNCAGRFGTHFIIGHATTHHFGIASRVIPKSHSSADSLAQRPEPADCPADRALIHLQPAIECIAFNVAREPHRLDPIRAEGRRRRHDAGRLHPRTRVSQAPWLKCRISCLAKGERAGTASAAMS